MTSLFYRINRSDTEDGAVIKGRMIGMDAIMVLLVSPIITFAVCYLRFSVYYVLACLGVMVLQLFAQRFFIRVATNRVVIRITYLGIPILNIDAPHDRVLLDDDSLKPINAATSSAYWKNRSAYIKIDDIGDFDTDHRYVTVAYRGKDNYFAAHAPKFEAQLWKDICIAFERAYEAQRKLAQ